MRARDLWWSALLVIMAHCASDDYHPKSKMLVATLFINHSSQNSPGSSLGFCCGTRIMGPSLTQFPEFLNN